MKKATITALLLGLSLTANAGIANHACKDAYAAKYQKMEDNKLVRNIGKGALYVAGGTAGFLLAPYAAATVVFTGIGVNGAFGGNLALDREAGLMLAEKVIAQANENEADVKAALTEQLIDEAYAALNKKNIKKGRTLLTRTEVEKEVQAGPARRHTSYVELVMQKVNRMGPKTEKGYVEYSDIQNDILEMAQTEEFCPTNKKGVKAPMTIKEIARMIGKKYKNKK